ncbi:unnamed protein product [Auanema sp. JU1783]|nr:unnamed protein product [Auanema sp. JU1783]
MVGPNIELSNGVLMPQFGLGTWQATKEEVKNAVHAALAKGYRLIDTAFVYSNEEAIGEALQEAFAAGVVKREDLFITTKAWAAFFDPAKIEEHLKDSLRMLQLEYVDLYLFHMPGAFKDMATQDHNLTVEQIWGGMETLYEKKLTRAVGVSNWSPSQIERVMKVAKVPIHNCQIELHLYWPQAELVQVCKKYNISVTSYASLGSPGRVNFTLPSGLKLNWAECPNQLQEPFVLELAEKYKKTAAQVLLRALIDRKIAIIPKSISEHRIQENIDIFDFELTAEELTKLDQVPFRQRLFLQDFLIGHPEDPFKDERV